MEIIEVEKPIYYRPCVKKAIMVYREKHIKEYNEYHRQLYHDKKDDPEWYEKYLERQRIYCKNYRDKKNLGKEPQKRGRPRKVIE
jgi:hypothetical protein